MTVLALVLAAVLLWPGRAAAVGSSGWRVPGRAPAAGGRAGRRARSGSAASLADAAEGIAMALQAGATPARAVAVAGQEAGPPWAETLDEVARRLASGGDAGGAWRRRAAEHPEARLLAGAWTLSERLGSPLAATVSQAATVTREDLAARRRLEAATSGPRATMLMLTVLPLVGLLAGLAFGLAPWAVVAHSGVTMLSVAGGLILTGAGWALCRAVLARAMRPELHR